MPTRFAAYTPVIFRANNVTYRDLPSSGRPSFPMFARYLARTDPSEYNDHWVPQWMHCRPCQADYDVVGRLETAAEDGEFVLRAAGLDPEELPELPWHNKSQRKHGKDRK